VRGSVVGATLTRLAPISAQDLAAVDPVKSRETRSRLKQRRHATVPRSRFRRNPAACLAALKQHVFQQLALPPKFFHKPHPDAKSTYAFDLQSIRLLHVRCKKG